MTVLIPGKYDPWQILSLSFMIPGNYDSWNLEVIIQCNSDLCVLNPVSYPLQLGTLAAGMTESHFFTESESKF